MIEMLHRYKTESFIIVLVCLLLWESYAPFRSMFIDGIGERTRHGMGNFLLGAINAIAISLVFVLSWNWAANWAEANQWGLANRLPLVSWQHAAITILLLDIWTYWFHRMSHELPFFWKFHRVHHSDRKMDVTTANRFHVGEIVLSSLLRILVVLMIGAHLWEILLYEIFMFPIVQFHHANIGLPEKLDRLLRIVIVTPAMHKVHHSDTIHETNSNYTSMLSIWDRIFGSFRLRADLKGITYGLSQLADPEHQTVQGMLKTPFVKIHGDAGSGSGTNQESST